MDRMELFETWAPRSSPWSAWAKPVLFAHLPRPLPLAQVVPAYDLSEVPPVRDRWAIVVEMSGVESVAIGLALARVGYRPVPVFNACPPPLSPPADPSAPARPVSFALVDVESILVAL